MRQELRVEDPTLLDPDQRRSLEDQVQLSGHRRSLELWLLLQLGGDAPAALPGGAWSDALNLGAQGRRFSISASAEAEARETLDTASRAIRRRAVSTGWSRCDSACDA
jgi:hypothetical protein